MSTELDEGYCKAISSRSKDMKLINSYFKDTVSKKYEPSSMVTAPAATQYSKSIIQKAYLYCLFSYLLDIVPHSNKKMTEAIYNFFTKNSDDPARENGFLTFISFLKYNETRLITKKYYELEIFNDPSVVKDDVGSAFIDYAETNLDTEIAAINNVIINRQNLDRPLILLGIYFIIMIIINIIFVLLLSYFIAGNNNFPEILRKILSNYLSSMAELAISIKDYITRKN